MDHEYKASLCLVGMHGAIAEAPHVLQKGIAFCSSSQVAPAQSIGTSERFHSDSSMVFSGLVWSSGVFRKKRQRSVSVDYLDSILRKLAMSGRHDSIPVRCATPSNWFEYHADLQLWDAETSELIWSFLAEAIMQIETVSQDPMYWPDIPRSH